jgi:hypothetical protein
MIRFPGFPASSLVLLACQLSASAQNPSIALRPAGRVELFNGRDLSGWTFASRSNAPVSATWNVTNGMIYCQGQPYGYARTTNAWQDYRLIVEWRFVKVAAGADNTGILVHIQSPDKIWPRCIQYQGKHDHQGDLFLMSGAESKEHRGMDANKPVPMRGPSKEKPVGEWNRGEVICVGDTVKAYTNGEFVNEVSGCTVSAGTIGIQSEGGEIEIRKMYLEPLKAQ